MKGFIRGLILGIILTGIICFLRYDPVIWENARLMNINDELKQQRVEIEADLGAADKYIGTLTYNFNFNMIKKNEKIKELRRILNEDDND